MSEPTRNPRRFHRLVDRAMESVVYVCGGVVLLTIVAIVYFLARESGSAFDRTFTYGFHFAAQPVKGQAEDIKFDPNASVLTLNSEADDALDSKEEVSPLPTLESIKGYQSLVTGVVLGGNEAKSNPENWYLSDWRAPKKPSQGHRWILLAFATPEYSEPTMKLAWDVTEEADLNEMPFAIRLRMLQAPKGIDVEPIDIDLNAMPKGHIELPTAKISSDAERGSAYMFEVVGTPRSNQIMATLRGFFSNEWSPTLAHPRYGLFPLLASTMLITLIALVIAIPISIASAIYLSELAPARIREILKPIIEMLASTPTVVLGYFGLMLIAPAVQRSIAAALGMDSGRNLLTAGLVMGILLVPTIMTIAEDALRNVPRQIRDGAIALGMTQRESLKHVVVPAARAGIIAAVMLGVARAFGETMVVWILSGGTPTMPTFSSLKDAAQNLVRPTRGIPDTIGIEIGNVTFGEAHYGHLFLLGLVLFIITLAINMVAFNYARRHACRY